MVLDKSKDSNMVAFTDASWNDDKFGKSITGNTVHVQGALVL